MSRICIQAIQLHQLVQQSEQMGMVFGRLISCAVTKIAGFHQSNLMAYSPINRTMVHPCSLNREGVMASADQRLYKLKLLAHIRVVLLLMILAG